MSHLTIVAHQMVNLPEGMVDKELRSLVKQETGLPVRRIDNFTLLSLLSVYRLVNQQSVKNTLSKHLSLYSVAEYLSIDLFQSVITDLQNNESIRPFDFIATVGNAANFYLAKEFFIKGPNVFVGASDLPFLKASLLADVDLEVGHCEQAIIVIWTQINNQRQCHAFIVEQTSKQDLSNLTKTAIEISKIDELLLQGENTLTSCIRSCIGPYIVECKL